jgi:hypothetical protein
MHAPAIRPRSAIEIVDASFSLFRDNFATMAVIGLAASVPFVILIALGFGAFTAGGAERLLTNPLAMMPMILALIAIFALWFAVIDGAMTFAAAEAYHGTRPSPGDALRGAFSKGLSLVGGNILRIVILGGGFMLIGIAVALVARLNGFLGFIVAVAAFVFAIHLFARTFAITSAIVIERRTAMDGVTRSFALSKESTLRIVGVFLLCGVIYIVAQLAGSMLIQTLVGIVLRSPVVAAVVGNIVSMLVYPFMNIALMVLYFDMRVRKEGYDLDVMSGAMAPAGTPRS